MTGREPERAKRTRGQQETLECIRRLVVERQARRATGDTRRGLHA
jgi:hypothetical protein